MNEFDNTGGATLGLADGVATIQFNRPAARNAMLQSTWCALPAMIAEADAGAAVIVLRGAGGNFGAGNDIAEFGQLRREPVQCREYGQAMADAMLAVERATKPVIAAIEGNCYGASVALTLAADMRIASSDARFAITPAKLGALYLRSDLNRLVAAIGQGQARRMIYTAVAIDADEAVAIGLVEQVLPADGFEGGLAKLLATMRRGSPYTLRHSKRMLRGVGHGESPQEDEQSLGWFVDAMQGADFAEGLAAFTAKRAPDFAR